MVLLNAQVEFSPPSASITTSANPFNGNVTASVCDQDGNPLIAVKKSGVIWVKGQDLGTIYSTQNNNNVIIVPKPKHPDRYFIIASSDITCNYGDYGLSYTEVDIKNRILLDTEISFNDINGNPTYGSSVGGGVASTTHVNGTDYWITAFANDILMSYLVTENGISTTPSGSMSLPSGYPDSVLKVKTSPQSYGGGKHIAVVNFYTGISVRNFNDETGEIAEDHSGMDALAQQKSLENWNNGVPARDVEFSSNGGALYFMDYYGLVYDILNGTEMTGWGGGYIASQLGPDGNVYFLYCDGDLYRQHPDTVGYPEWTPAQLFSGSQFQQWEHLYQYAHLPQLVSISQCLGSPPTPTFNIPAYICKGTALEFSDTSLEGITGSWSPAPNYMVTTTYTFTADSEQCSVDKTSIIVNVNDQNTVPVFYPYEIYLPDSLCVGDSYSFPNTSSNKITGTWSPEFSNTETRTYTFTPNTQCGTTITHTIEIKEYVIPTFDTIGTICSGTHFQLPNNSKNGIYGWWFPDENSTTTTTYTYEPIIGCGLPTTMTVKVNPAGTPIFDAIPYVCSGMSFNPLSETSNNGIIGSWSPAFNNTTTKTYTFTPDGHCGPNATMTIEVKPVVTPLFNDVATISGTSISYALPATTNGIAGTWNPPALIEGDHDYTFTPSGGSCVANVTKNYFWSEPKAIEAHDDYFSSVNFGNNGGGFLIGKTPSVFNNDHIIGEALSPSNTTVSIIGVEPSAYYDLLDQHNRPHPGIDADGYIYLSGISYNGEVDITYKIVQNSCSSSSNYSIATAKIILGGTPSTGKKVQSPEEQLTEVIPVYPNPSSGVFNIDLSNVEEDYNTVQVYNILGKLVYQRDLRSKSSNKIDLSDMSEGLYIAKVSGAGRNAMFKLIKQ